MKQQINFRASVQTRRELEELRAYMGDTQTSIIERAIAELYTRILTTGQRLDPIRETLQNPRQSDL